MSGKKLPGRPLNLGVRVHGIENLYLVVSIDQLPHGRKDLSQGLPERLPPMGRKQNQAPPPIQKLTEILVLRLVG